MWLYSVASGVSCAGAFLMIGVVGAMLITKAFSGSLFGVFNPRNGIGWPLIFMAIYGVLSIAVGPITAILLGYQQVDWFVLLISVFVAYGFAWSIYGVLHGLSEKTYRRKLTRQYND
jgi:hypothetical protein